MTSEKHRVSEGADDNLVTALDAIEQSEDQRRKTMKVETDREDRRCYIETRDSAKKKLLQPPCVG